MNIELKSLEMSNIPEKSRELEGFKIVSINIQVKKDEIIFIFLIYFLNLLRRIHLDKCFLNKFINQSYF